MPDNDVCELLVPLNSGIGCWILWSVALGIAVFAVTLLCFAYKWYRRRGRAERQACLDPYQEAMFFLEKARQCMLEADDVVFANALTDAVRQYLAREWRMPAPECTTEEFLSFLMPDVRFDSVVKEDLRDLLIHADLAKFARQRWQFEERERRHVQAQCWIEKVHTQKVESQRRSVLP